MNRPSIGLVGPLRSGKTTLADHLQAAHGYRRASFGGPVYALAETFLGRPVVKASDRAVLQAMNCARDARFQVIASALEPRSGASRALSACILADEIDARTGHAAQPEGGVGMAAERLARLLYPTSPGTIAYARGFGSPAYYVDRLMADLMVTGGLLVSDRRPGADALTLHANPARPVVVDDVRKLNEAQALRDAGFILVRVDTPRAAVLDRIRSEGGDPAALEHETETEANGIVPDHFIPGEGDPARNVADFLQRIAR